MPRFLPVGKDSQGAARFLLAALPALGALLTALAITGDLVGRMARDHPWATFAAFGCGAVAVFLGAVAAFGFRESSREERQALYLGLLVLGAGLVFTVYAGVTTWGDRPQPSVTLTPRHGPLVGVTVHGTGLRSTDHLVVEVEQLLRTTDEQGQLTWKPGQPLYSASLGPDGSGDVAQTVDVPLPPGDFDDVGARVWVGTEPKDCYAARTTGCVRVHIPRPQERPQLAVDWETFVRAPRVLIRVKAHNLPPRPSRSMTLRVYGIAPNVPARVLAAWFLAPDADGVFDRHLSVVVGHAFTDVCIVASITTRDPPCPAPVEDGTVWSQLAVPPA
jgi:hypothetical protein